MSTDAATAAHPDGGRRPLDLDEPAYRAAVVDLLGTVAYGELMAFTELTADSTFAPCTSERVALCLLAGRELHHFERLAERLRDLGADPDEAMAPFAPALDGYHARTQGSTWPERLVKAYVGEGIRTDFYCEVAGLVDPQTAALVTEVSGAQDARDAVLVEGVRAAIVADPSVEGRLALWGRRLMGEALSQAQRVAAEREALSSLLIGGIGGGGGDIAALGAMVSRMTAAHGERMARLGLSA